MYEIRSELLKCNELELLKELYRTVRDKEKDPTKLGNRNNIHKLLKEMQKL